MAQPFYLVLVLFASMHWKYVTPYTASYSAVSSLRDVLEDSMVEAKAKAKARGLRGRGQGQIILDQGHVRLYNPTWLVRLHRWFLEEVYISVLPSKVLPNQTNSVERCNILMMHCALL